MKFEFKFPIIAKLIRNNCIINSTFGFVFAYEPITMGLFNNKSQSSIKHVICHTRLTLSKQHLHWRCHHNYILNFVLIYIFVLKELRHKILFGRLKTFIIHIFFILLVYILRQYFFIQFFFYFCLNSIDGKEV